MNQIPIIEKIIEEPSFAWGQIAGDIIRRQVDQYIASAGVCTMMLTGGKTVQPIYRYWADKADFPYERVRYFFGDERCVPPENQESNYYQAVKALFPYGIPKSVEIHRMEGEVSDLNAAARRYESILPDAIDILLLGMGEDGHIASLFPEDVALTEMKRRVLHVIGTKPPLKRMTITPAVIKSANRSFYWQGDQKKARYLRVP